MIQKVIDANFSQKFREIEKKEKRTHGHGKQCGDCWGEGGIKALNDNGKKYDKD